MDRRNFLKIVAGGTAGGAAVAAAGSAVGSPAKMPDLPPQAVGMLYDASLCIGCKLCMAGCKKANCEPGGVLHEEDGTIPYEYASEDRIWDAPAVLTANSLTVIKVHRKGSGTDKDGNSFAKKNCMHCVEPACVSVCPVGALQKNPTTGVVYYQKEPCIGCRYCMMSCPYDVPRFEWRSTSPRIRKCQLCAHRLAKGRTPGCCEACPTGASLFGPVTALREEAKKRLTLRTGQEYAFPVATVDSKQRSTRAVAPYIDQVYGMTEAGGTQVLALAAVPFALLGFNPRIPNRALPELTWAYISKVPAVLGGVIIVGAASWFFTRQNAAREEK